MIDKESLERFKLLERKMDEGTATDEELFERDMLWTMLEIEEDENNRQLYQFGY